MITQIHALQWDKCNIWDKSHKAPVQDQFWGDLNKQFVWDPFEFTFSVGKSAFAFSCLGLSHKWGIHIVFAQVVSSDFLVNTCSVHPILTFEQHEGF